MSKFSSSHAIMKRHVNRRIYCPRFFAGGRTLMQCLETNESYNFENLKTHFRRFDELLLVN